MTVTTAVVAAETGATSSPVNPITDKVVAAINTAVVKIRLAASGTVKSVHKIILHHLFITIPVSKKLPTNQYIRKPQSVRPHLIVLPAHANK